MQCLVDFGDLLTCNVLLFFYQLVSLGGFILFFGFLAFNGGSQGAITGEGDGDAVALAIVNTVISGKLTV